MAVPFSNIKLRVPKGFQNVLLVLNKEILREQPRDIVAFSADFLQKLLHIREVTGHDPAVEGAHSDDRYYNNFAFKQTQPNASGPPTNTMKDGATSTSTTTTTTASTSGHQSSLKKEGEEEEIDIDLNDPAVQDAAVKIQAQFRGFRFRQGSLHSKD